MDKPIETISRRMRTACGFRKSKIAIKNEHDKDIPGKKLPGWRNPVTPWFPERGYRLQEDSLFIGHKSGRLQKKK